jgi:small-conductance mechanosensitive channel
MRQIAMLVWVLVVAVAFTSTRSDADEPKKAETKPENKLVGTWKQVSAKYDGQQSTIPEGITVDIDRALAFVVTPGDVDDLGGATLQSTAEEAVRQLTLALREAQEQASVRQLLKAVLLTLLATLIYTGVLYGIVFANRRLGERLTSAVRAKVEKLKVAGVIAVHPRHLLTFARRLVVLSAWLLGLFATYLWLTYVLRLFPYTRPWGEQLRSYLVGMLSSMLHGIVYAIPGLLTVVVIFVITRTVVHLLDGFFQRVEAQHIRIGWLDEDTARPTRRIVAVVLWLFALVMAYPYLPGANTDAFKGLSVLVGLMVSIGASSLVAQAASGMILMYSRTLRAGEYVKIADAEGTVAELGLFATRIQTGTGEELILPNAFVVANTTRNFSRTVSGHGFVLQVTVTIGYSTPWRQVHAMLLEAAGRTHGILDGLTQVRSKYAHNMLSSSCISLIIRNGSACLRACMWMLLTQCLI